jgi:hypothetical protein
MGATTQWHVLKSPTTINLTATDAVVFSATALFSPPDGPDSSSTSFSDAYVGLWWDGQPSAAACLIHPNTLPHFPGSTNQPTPQLTHCNKPYATTSATLIVFLSKPGTLSVSNLCVQKRDPAEHTMEADLEAVEVVVALVDRYYSYVGGDMHGSSWEQQKAE